MRPAWLDRNLMVCRVHYTLCITEQAFRRELKRLDVAAGDQPHFAAHNGASTSHGKYAANGNAWAIVTLDHADAIKRKVRPIQIAALLVHEAVHIWQKHAALIGSWNDHGDEDEAYAIQSISQNLMFEYVRQTTKGK